MDNFDDLESNYLWLVGTVVKEYTEGSVWYIEGLFSTIEKAVEAAKEIKSKSEDQDSIFITKYPLETYEIGKYRLEVKGVEYYENILMKSKKNRRE